MSDRTVPQQRAQAILKIRNELRFGHNSYTSGHCAKTSIVSGHDRARLSLNLPADATGRISPARRCDTEGAQAFQGESIAQIVEHHAFQLLGQRHACITGRQRRLFDNLLGDLTCTA